MSYLNDSYIKEFKAKIISINSNKIILNQTFFYSKSGGQPSDIGELISEKKRIKIIDTIKDNQNNIIHISENETDFEIGEEITGYIDWNIRYQYMKMHTSLHILCSIIPFSVTGGQIGYEKSRLDFNLENSSIDKNIIQEKINNILKDDHKVEYEWITNEDLDKKPELVRTMSVKPPRISGKIRLVKIGNIDLQPCGGTHVRSTKEIGKIIIKKIENKGKKNRRINIILD